MNDEPLPLFPLSTVLFPGGELALRIFETRYIDMVRNCMRSNKPFGVVLIKRGSDTGSAQTYDIGTNARIVDWRIDRDGLLGISVRGNERFVLRDYYRDRNGLYMGLVRELPVESPRPLQPEHEGLRNHYRASSADVPGPASAAEDAVWLSYRLAERLPIDWEFKQSLLECADVDERLNRMAQLLDAGVVYGSSLN